MLRQSDQVQSTWPPHRRQPILSSSLTGPGHARQCLDGMSGIPHLLLQRNRDSKGIFAVRDPLQFVRQILACFPQHVSRLRKYIGSDLDVNGNAVCKTRKAAVSQKRGIW